MEVVLGPFQTQALEGFCVLGRPEKKSTYPNEETTPLKGSLGRGRITEYVGRERSPAPAISPRDCNHRENVGQTGKRTSQLRPAHKNIKKIKACPTLLHLVGGRGLYRSG